MSSTISDSQALDAIAAILTGSIWSPDTLEEIAEVVRSTDRTIADP